MYLMLFLSSVGDHMAIVQHLLFSLLLAFIVNGIWSYLEVKRIQRTGKKTKLDFWFGSYWLDDSKSLLRKTVYFIFITLLFSILVNFVVILIILIESH